MYLSSLVSFNEFEKKIETNGSIVRSQMGMCEEKFLQKQKNATLVRLQTEGWLES